MGPNKVYHSHLNPVSFLQRSAFIYPDKVAVVYGPRRITFRRLEERVHRLASHLRADGLQKHDRVAFLCPNTPPLLEAHFAVPAAGGVLVAINTRLGRNEIEQILRHSGATFLFVDAELEHLVADLDLPDLRVIHISDSDAADDPYEQYLAAGDPAPLVSWLEDEEELISINYTSGTTGQPKGVMYSYRGAYLNALAQVAEAGLTPDSVYLWTLPMFHCNGWCFPWALAAIGAASVCLRRFDPKTVWELFESERVSHYCAAPTVQLALINHPLARSLDHPITTLVAGAPPSPTLLSGMRERNLRPIHVYGLTETYGPVTICAWRHEWDSLPADEQARMNARQGQGNITSDLVRVVDDTMNDVPRDGATLGEVVMRGNIVMLGYYNQPEATEAAFRGGWFHSGDLAVWHPDGYVELRDRKKDIIISGGENISTIEVEQAISRHPAVLECAVVAIPDEKWGERPKAFVTLKPGCQAGEAEIIAFCRDQIAHYKCPAAVEFGDLPKTSTGKVQKFALRAKEWAGRDKQIN